MKIINAGIVLVIFALSFFITDSIKLLNLGRALFDRTISNINMDKVAEDVLYYSVTGIDELGKAVTSEEKVKAEYKWLAEKSLNVNADDNTGFLLITGNEDIEAEFFEIEAEKQIKSLDKRLNYNFLFTEKTFSKMYNPICKNSVYIMFLPKFSNMLRMSGDDIIYTLSGAMIE